MGDSFYKRSEPKNSADYFATPPNAVWALHKHEKFRTSIIEPCCGEGHLSKALESLGYNVKSSDIVYRGFGRKGSFDFLSFQPEDLCGSDVVTNPPYNQASKIITHALKFADNNAKIAMLLRLTFLESMRRKPLFDEFPPTRIYIFRQRIGCAKNGKFKIRANGELYYPSAVAYAWFVWDKSVLSREAPPQVFWLDPPYGKE